MHVNNQAILFCAHTYRKAAFLEFKRIFRAAESMGPCLVLWDRSGSPRHQHKVSRFPRHEFDLQSLSSLKLPLLCESNITPGCVHFPLIQYAHAHPFEYYWLIEHDVRFTGNWSLLFDYFESADDDLIGTHIERHTTLSSQWYWWSSLTHPTKKIPDTQKLRCFMPIYRISLRALLYIERMHKQGWVGHMELLIPTLLAQGGFKLRDFGGVGEFVGPADRNRFYLDYGWDQETMQKGTMRWQPPHYFVWYKPNNKLYHPVKLTLPYKKKKAIKRIIRSSGLLSYFPKSRTK